MKYYLAKKSKEEFSLLEEHAFATDCPKALKAYLELASIEGEFKPPLREIAKKALKSAALKYGRHNPTQ